VWYQLPVLDGRASDDERWKAGEQGRHCLGEEGRKDGRQTGREVEGEEGDERRWMGWTQRRMERGTDGGRL